MLFDICMKSRKLKVGGFIFNTNILPEIIDFSPINNTIQSYKTNLI